MAATGFGKAHKHARADTTYEEMAHNPRYTWSDEMPLCHIRRLLPRGRLIVRGSNIKGPNFLSELILARLPVSTTDIDGCIGVLGPDYPGTYPVGNSDAFRRQLIRAKSEPFYLTELEQYVEELAPRVSHQEEEHRSVKLREALFDEVLGESLHG